MAKQQGYILDVENQTLQLKGGKEIYDASEMNEDISLHLKIHGFKQKLVDGCAGLKKALGRELTTDDYEGVMNATYASLKSGTWNQKRETTTIPQPEKLRNKANAMLESGEVDSKKHKAMMNGIEAMETAGVFTK